MVVRRLIRRVYSSLDALSYSVCEVVKTFVIEMKLLFGDIVDAILSIVLFLFFDISKFFSHGIKRLKVISREKSKKMQSKLNEILRKSMGNKEMEETLNDSTVKFSPEPPKSDVDWDPLNHSFQSEYGTYSNIESASVLSLDDLIERERSSGPFLKRVFKNILKLIFVIPHLVIGRLYEKEDVMSNLQIKYEEKKMTGLFEDLHTKSLEAIDLLGKAWRHGIRLQLISSFQTLYSILKLYSPSSFLTMTDFDERTIEQRILDEGCPCEVLSVETSDGYILSCERIVNRKSKNVVYFQHGILDTSYCWVGNQDRSLAFSCFSRGYDVFLGNFRGRGFDAKTQHRNKNISGDKYWDFCIDELIERDFPAFINKILEVKRSEFQDDNVDINITVVSHSMGGAVALGYLVDRLVVKRKEHHVNKAIILTPGGIHSNLSLFWRGLSKFIFILYWLDINYLGVNNKTFKILMAKLFQDLMGKESSRSFCSVVVSSLIGGQHDNSALNMISNLLFHIFFGTSRKLLQHFVQLIGKGQFNAFDYGKKGNLRKYMTANPLCYSDHYNQIDIPVVLLAGSDDNVIPESDVKKHYIRMIANRVHPNVVHKWKVCCNVGHIDVTYSMKSEVFQYVNENLRLDNK